MSVLLSFRAALATLVGSSKLDFTRFQPGVSVGSFVFNPTGLIGPISVPYASSRIHRSERLPLQH